jgi:hypothetical protein
VGKLKISPSRVVHIFRHKGGSGEFTKTGDELTEGESRMILAEMDGESPLIVSVRSKDEWFVLTESRIVLRNSGGLHSAKLLDIDTFFHSGIRELARGKLDGGKFELRLKGGSRLNIDAESGRPFISLLNVFMYLEKINRKSRTPVSEAGTATTGPTTMDSAEG